MYRGKNEVGNKYGKLFVIKIIGSADRGIKWLCKCECGNDAEVFGSDLRSGNTSSCGCVYTIDETGNTYGKYLVLGKWQEKLDYRGAAYWKCKCSCGKIRRVRGDQLRKLDRIDVYGNYEPGNIRWANSSEQVNNRRLVLLSEEEYSLIMKIRQENKR